MSLFGIVTKGSKIYDIAIIGGGASGLFLATFLQDTNHCIIEKNDKTAKKLLISGGGRCNIANKFLNSSKYLGGQNFIETIFEQYDQNDIVSFLHKNKIKFAIENKGVEGQYFLNSSKDIESILKRLITKTTVLTNNSVKDVQYDDNSKYFIIITDKTTIKSKKLVVASGGISYPQVGVSDVGFKIAQFFGHKIITTKPSLVGFSVQKDEFWFKDLSGISVYGKIIVEGFEDREIKGNILFTHKGISGPAILNSSLYWDKGKILINFLPDMDIKYCLKDKNKQISTQLPLPRDFTKSFLQKIELDDKKIKDLKQTEFTKLELLQKYLFSPAGTFGYSKAETTKGGVCTLQIDPTNMESKLMENLFFVGEVLDVTGELGGYNLQWAFSSAFVCAKKLTEK